VKLRPRSGPRLDRRALLTLSGAAALSLAAPSGIKSAAAAPRGGATLLAVADPRYGDSLGFARGLERQGASVLRLAPNAGAVWFDAVAPRLRRGGSLAGLTLDSDFFILQHLAESGGAVTRFVGCHDWRCQSGAVHKLSASIELDAIASAVAGGEGAWAESLAAALAGAGRQVVARQQRWVRQAGAAAADSPRYFVSWLMTLAV
jgi:hypothetical protein